MNIFRIFHDTEKPEEMQSDECVIVWAGNDNFYNKVMWKTKRKGSRRIKWGEKYYPIYVKLSEIESCGQVFWDDSEVHK